MNWLQRTALGFLMGCTAAYFIQYLVIGNPTFAAMTLLGDMGIVACVWVYVSTPNP